MTDYKPGDIVDGRYKVLKNGAGYDTQIGRISHAPGTYSPDVPNGTIQTTEHAQALVKRRHEAVREKTRQRTVERFKETGQIPEDANFVDAIAEVGSEALQSSLANMMDKPREAVHAGQFGLRLAGMDDFVSRQVASAGQVVAIQVVIGGDVMEQVKKLAE